MTETDSVSQKRIPRGALSWLLIIIVTLGVCVALLFIVKNNPHILGLQRSESLIQKDKDEIVKKVKKLMELPQEEPTVATITDKDKLSNQPFFAQSQNGDWVLIYTQAKKAILFRPSTGKIIDVAPVNIGTQSAAPTTKPPTFILFNGTPTTGLTKKYDSQLKEKIPSAEVLDRDNAKKKDYAKSLIIDLKGTQAVQTAEFAKLLNLEVSQLPEGETKPEADFLIILGTDKQ